MVYYTLNGESHTLSDWSRKLGVPMGRIAARLRRGVPFDKAVSPRRLPTVDKSPQITYEGETHTLREWARKLGLPYARIHARWVKGGDPGRILSAKILERGGPSSWKPEIFLSKKGETHSVHEWARRIGINAYTIYRRLARCGGDVSKTDYILSQKSMGMLKGEMRGPFYTAHGLTLSVPAWARHLGCTVSLLYKRLRKGLPPDKVFVKPASKYRSPFLYTKDGETLPLKGWAKKLGLSIHALRARMIRSKDLAYVLSPRKPRGFEQAARARRNVGVASR